MSAFRRSEQFVARPTAALDPVEHEGWRLKVYAITYGPAPLQRAVYNEGLVLAFAALPRPAVTPSRPGVGFVILHQGRSMHYLVLSWWDNENEYFNRVFVRPIAGEELWRAASAGESACVWDLEIIWAERQAYVRHVLSPARGPDVTAYLGARATTGP